MKHVDMLINRYPILAECREEIEKVIEGIVSMHENGGTLLLCGNGGSAADSEHISGELLKGFLSKRPSTVTPPAAISFLAFSRLGAKPCSVK